MKRQLLTYYILIIGLTTYGQKYRSRDYWSFGPSLGVSNLLGDLGGSVIEGGGSQTLRPSIGGTGLYNLEFISFGANLNMTRLVGNDALTPSKAGRNLSVRTDIADANIQIEIKPFSNKELLSNLYFAGGVGWVIYQPKAKLNDEWIKLRRLGTEGQLVPGAGGKYNMGSLVIPFGVGYKFKLTPKTIIGIDFSFRKSFTDYLDDVSTVYAEPSQLRRYGGNNAVALGDRTLNGATPGQARGNPLSNDSYFIFSIKFEKRYFPGRDFACNFNRASDKKLYKDYFKRN